MYDKPIQRPVGPCRYGVSMTNSPSTSPTSAEVLDHFRNHVDTVLPPAGLHVEAITEITYADRTVAIRIDPAKAGAEDWAFDDVFKPIGLAEIYGGAIGFNDEAGTRMRTVVDNIVVLDRDGAVYDSIDIGTLHRKCAGTE